MVVLGGGELLRRLCSSMYELIRESYQYDTALLQLSCIRNVYVYLPFHANRDNALKYFASNHDMYLSGNKAQEID